MAKNNKNILYQEVQHFRQIWLWIIILAISVFAIYSMIQQLILGKPLGDHPVSDAVLLIIVVVFGFALPIFCYIMKLVTEVRKDGLYIRFFPFHLSFHKIPLENLNSYEARTYSALKEYGGWGIRYGSKGKAYNVSGNRGVQLEFSNGDRILIGSRKAEELAQAIALAISDIHLM